VKSERLAHFNASQPRGLAGDRTLEDVMRLVARVDGQFEREAVLDVNVDERPLLAVLPHPLALDLVGHALVVQRACNGLDAVGKQVQVNVRTAADVTGQGAADQPGAEGPKETPFLDGGRSRAYAEGGGKASPTFICCGPWIVLPSCLRLLLVSPEHNGRLHRFNDINGNGLSREGTPTGYQPARSASVK
jgi:hypothetical protein